MFSCPLPLACPSCSASCGVSSSSRYSRDTGLWPASSPGLLPSGRWPLPDLFGILMKRNPRFECSLNLVFPLLFVFFMSFYEVLFHPETMMKLPWFLPEGVRFCFLIRSLLSILKNDEVPEAGT